MRLTTVESDEGFSGSVGGLEDDVEAVIGVTFCGIELDEEVEGVKPVQTPLHGLLSRV